MDGDDLWWRVHEPVVLCLNEWVQRSPDGARALHVKVVYAEHQLANAGHGAVVRNVSHLDCGEEKYLFPFTFFLYVRVLIITICPYESSATHR